MTDKEKLDSIRAEIHKLVHVNGYSKEMANELFAFINSLPEERVSEDLDEAAERHALQCHSKKASVAKLAASIYDFRAGANWQKEQIMKDVVEGKVNYKRTLDYVKPDDSL